MKHKFYINGNKDKGEKVIQALIDKGGKNINGLCGNNSEFIYYIGDEEFIHYLSKDSTLYSLVTDVCKEIDLNEEENKIDLSMTNVGDLFLTSKGERARLISKTGANLYYPYIFIIERKENGLNDIIYCNWHGETCGYNSYCIMKGL